MNKQRQTAVEKEIKRLLGTLLLTEVKNSKVKGMISVTKVMLTKDAKYADIFVSVLNTGGNLNRKELLEGLDSAKGFMRKRLGEELNLRYVPALRFKLDDSIEHGAKINKIIDGLK